MRATLFGNIRILVGGDIVLENREIMSFNIIEFDDIKIITDTLNDLKVKYDFGTFYAIIEDGDLKYKLELIK